MRPLLDQRAKEGKDKKVVFDAGFSKPNCKPKWFFRKDVSKFNFLFSLISEELKRWKNQSKPKKKEIFF